MKTSRDVRIAAFEVFQKVGERGKYAIAAELMALDEKATKGSPMQAHLLSVLDGLACWLLRMPIDWVSKNHGGFDRLSASVALRAAYLLGRRHGLQVAERKMPEAQRRHS